MFKTLAPAVGSRIERSGCTLFFYTASNISSLEMLFPASLSTYSFALSKLGEVRI